MHGLINRSIQCFLQDTYGPPLWRSVAEESGGGGDGFEAMLNYEDRLTDDVLGAACRHLDKSREALLEDMGTYLVSNPRLENLRRLLRFGGSNFLQFLHSLDDLRGRAKLAVDDLDLPDLEVIDDSPVAFRLECRWHWPGSGHLMTGLLRAMADDYGALVLLEVQDARNGVETVVVELLDSAFSEGRSFDLAARAG